MRACERVFRRPFKTIRKIVQDVGDWAIDFHHHEPAVVCEKIQTDEIWSFVGENTRNNAFTADKEKGVCWTYLAVDRPTKLLLTYHIGSRQAVDATKFFRKLDARLAKNDCGEYLVRPTIAFDGLKAYVDAAERVFGDQVDAGQFVKKYSKLDENGEPLPGSRYVGADRNILKGCPEIDDITTWLVERENGFLRQANRRFTRKTNAFSKDMIFHERQIAIWMFYRNYCWIPCPSRPRAVDSSRSWSKRATAAQNAGLSDVVWNPEDMIAASDEFLARRTSEPNKTPTVLVQDASDPYWVLHSPYHRSSKVHLSDCSSCNGGLGKNKGPTQRSVWTSFPTLEDAVRFAADREPDGHSLCRLCLESYFTLNTYGRRR